MLSKHTPGQEICGCTVMLQEKTDACVGHHGDRLSSWGNHSLGMNGIKSLERSKLPMPTNVPKHHSLPFALADTVVKELLSTIGCLSSSLLLHYPFFENHLQSF